MRRSACANLSLGIATAALLGVASSPACNRDRGSKLEPSDLTPPRIVELSIDAANRPRDGGPLIAGEEARVELRIHGGAPPYQITLRARPDGAGAPALEAHTEVRPDEPNAGGVEVATRASIEPAAASGSYRLEVEVADRTGARAHAAPQSFSVIGAGAALLPAPEAVPFVDITDAGGRRRASFIRGEELSLHAQLAQPAPTKATVRVRDPAGELVGERNDLPVDADGNLSLSFPVPRLARAGTYEVEVTADSAPPLRGRLAVDGPAFPPATRLVVDDLHIRGGADGRSLRRGRLRRGETVLIEARVGGARNAPVAILRLPDGSETEISSASVASPAPDKRIFLRGQWRVPGTMPAGRSRLELEVTDGDDVSTRYRDVLIE